MVLGSGCKPLAAEDRVKYVSFQLPPDELQVARTGTGLPPKRRQRLRVQPVDGSSRPAPLECPLGSGLPECGQAGINAA